MKRRNLREDHEDYLIDTGMMDKMKKNNMSIRNIDNDGDADVNHYFLRNTE